MFFSYGLNVLIILISILTGTYLYLTRKFNYWTERGINGPKPIVLFGTLYQNFTKSLPEIMVENSKKYGKIHGVFMGSSPVLVVSEPALIKDMTTKHLNKFVDRHHILTGDPMNDRSLFNINGNEWQKLRSIINPTFSSGKMRSMHPIIKDCVHRLETVLRKKCLNRDVTEIELKKLMRNLTMDVIGSCAFGTRIHAYSEDTRSEFITNAEKTFRHNWRVFLFFFLMKTFPKILELTQFRSTDPNVSNFFRSAIRSIITSRKLENTKHNDYLQLMINAQNKALNEEDLDIDDDNSDQIFGQSVKVEITNNTRITEQLTEDDILANSVLFFIAGYETSASLLSYLCYSLALNEKCQQKLFEEVKSYNGNYDYDCIAKMHYLEACVAETLRLYNPTTILFRLPSEDYPLGDTGITIPKGMLVNIDIESIHRNPEYYPNPNVWSPERFLPENRDQLTPYTYMPFGLGPRNCVGMRFALMEAKTAIVHLVLNYKFLKTANTAVPLIPLKNEFLLNCGDVNVGIGFRD